MDKKMKKVDKKVGEMDKKVDEVDKVDKKVNKKVEKKVDKEGRHFVVIWQGSRVHLTGTSRGF